jgi:FKBP-type peptidyl-prolyl cis-trans isomerase
VEARRTDSGLELLDVAAGEGAEASAGSRVRLRYAGWLTDGTLFERTEERRALEVKLGVGALIPGLEEGIPGMRAGGRRRLIVPSDLAYGPRGRPGRVPPFATLIFDVELVAVK